MKKFFFIAVLFITFAVSVSAQDMIVLINGNIIEAKILEILPTEIRYKRFDNLNGPIHVILKREVYSIRYENGIVDVINSPASVGNVKQKPDEQTMPAIDPDKLYFSLSFEPSGFLMGGPSVTGEFLKGANFSSLYMSFPSLAADSKAEPGSSFGLGGSLNHIWMNKKFSGFYLGGLFEWNTYPYEGTFSNPYGEYDPISDSYKETKVNEEIQAHNFVIGLNTGYRFGTSSGVYFRTGVTLGMKLSNVMDTEFYFKPDVSTGYVFGGSAAARSAKGAQVSNVNVGVASTGEPIKVDLSKLSTINIDSGSSAETALKGSYTKLEGVRNRAPLTKEGSDVLILLPPEALPSNLLKYNRLTITAKYYDAANREIPQSDSQVMVTVIYYLNSDIRGPSNGPGTNTPIKEFNVGGPSGQINKDSGIKINFRQQPEAIMLQNTNPNVAFIELTSIVFHNGNYKSE